MTLCGVRGRDGAFIFRPFVVIEHSEQLTQRIKPNDLADDRSFFAPGPGITAKVVKATGNARRAYEMGALSE